MAKVVKLQPKSIHYRYAKRYTVVITFNPITNMYDWETRVGIIPVRDSAKTVAGAKRMAGRRIEAAQASLNGTGAYS